MGQYYRDVEHLYEIYGYFLRGVLSDPKVGPKMDAPARSRSRS